MTLPKVEEKDLALSLNLLEIFFPPKNTNIGLQFGKLEWCQQFC